MEDITDNEVITDYFNYTLNVTAFGGTPLDDCKAGNVYFVENGIANLVVGTPIVILNGLLLFSLYKIRRCFSGKRMACTLNLTVSDFLCGLVLLIRGISQLGHNQNVFSAILDLELCANILLTIINYTLALFIQYLAVKQPLYYQTRLTLMKILLIIGLAWLIVVFYIAIKAYIIFFTQLNGDIIFRAVDVVAMGFSLSFNTLFYIYVLRVVSAKRKESLKRRKISEKLPSLSLSISRTGSEGYLLPASSSQMTACVMYNAVVGLGIQLITYVCTVLPLFIFWSYTLIYGFECLRMNLSVISCALESFWFARAVIDPMTFMLRERRCLAALQLDWLLSFRLKCFKRQSKQFDYATDEKDDDSKY